VASKASREPNAADSGLEYKLAVYIHSNLSKLGAFPPKSPEGGDAGHSNVSKFFVCMCGAKRAMGVPREATKQSGVASPMQSWMVKLAPTAKALSARSSTLPLPV
jgi:hypothetical protein